MANSSKRALPFCRTCYQILLFFLAWLPLGACGQEPAKAPDSGPWADSAASRSASGMDAAFLRGLPYQLTRPVFEQTLPSELREVSGISWAGPGMIAMVQDEKGVIFIWDEFRREVVATYRFAGQGDYEGLALDKETAWVISSDGVLYQVDQFAENRRRKVRSYPSGLTIAEDVEGLALHKSGRRLLLAGKEIRPGAPAHLRYIYSWHIGKKAPEPEPFLVLDLNEVKDALGRDGKDFDPQKKSSMKISGLAVHPRTGDLYLLASVGKLLVVVRPDGKVKHAASLDPRMFPQPEGICFSPDGDLYIASEGKGTKGKLWKFESK